MTGYVIRRGHAYLELLAFDQTYGWHAGSQEHATVFSQDVAQQIAAVYGPSARVLTDYYARPIQIAELPEFYRPLIDAQEQKTA